MQIIVNGKPQFDHKVHHMDPKTGQLVKTNHYIMRVSQQNGVQYFRGGKEYYPDGSVRRVLAPEPAPAVVKAAEEALQAAASEPTQAVAPVVENSASAEEAALGVKTSAE